MNTESDDGLFLSADDEYFIERYLYGDRDKQEDQQLEQLANEVTRMGYHVDDLYEKQRSLEKRLLEQEERIQALIEFSARTQSKRKRRR